MRECCSAKQNDQSHLSPLELSKPKNLGLKDGLLHSSDVSLAASPADSVEGQRVEDNDSERGIKTSGPNQEDFVLPSVEKSNKDRDTMEDLKDLTDCPDIQNLPESEQKLCGQLTSEK